MSQRRLVSGCSRLTHFLAAIVPPIGFKWGARMKMDKEMDTATVKGKRDAARRWANYVTADESVGVPWRYLLASEADVETARGSWPALRTLADS